MADSSVTPFLPPADSAKTGKDGLVSLVHVAAASGSNDELATYLDAGFAVDERSGGWTLLHCAAAENRASTIELLVARGANVSPPDEPSLYECATPLALAASRGHRAALDALLACGADPNGGALHAAAEQGQLGIVHAL